MTTPALTPTDARKLPISTPSSQGLSSEGPLASETALVSERIAAFERLAQPVSISPSNRDGQLASAIPADRPAPLSSPSSVALSPETASVMVSSVAAVVDELPKPAPSAPGAMSVSVQILSSPAGISDKGVSAASPGSSRSLSISEMPPEFGSSRRVPKLPPPPPRPERRSSSIGLSPSQLSLLQVTSLHLEESAARARSSSSASLGSAPQVGAGIGQRSPTLKPVSVDADKTPSAAAASKPSDSKDANSASKSDKEADAPRRERSQSVSSAPKPKKKKNPYRQESQLRIMFRESVNNLNQFPRRRTDS